MIAIGLVLIFCFLFAFGVRHHRLGVVELAAAMTITGIILNRLYNSVIASNWNAREQYFPIWMEFVVTLITILTQGWVFRWIELCMPVLRKVVESQQTMQGFEYVLKFVGEQTAEAVGHRGGMCPPNLQKSRCRRKHPKQEAIGAPCSRLREKSIMTRPSRMAMPNSAMKPTDADTERYSLDALHNLRAKRRLRSHDRSRLGSRLNCE